MNMTKITIGIPAYNEEGNIGHLIDSLLHQELKSLVIEKIIVNSDGSSDKTNEIVKGYGDQRVLLIGDGSRKGQSVRQNEILDAFSGDILVLLNGDVIPTDAHFLENICSPMLADRAIGLVAARTSPLKPETFFERILEYSVRLKDDMTGNIDNGNNIYFCRGTARAFSSQFAKKFRLPEVVSEDAYSYLKCKEEGFRFEHSEKARVYYRLPQHFQDHLRQSARFMQGKNDLMKYIDPEVVRKEHHIPISNILRSGLKYFFKNPLLLTSYAIVVVLIKTMARLGKNYAVVTWETANSSKILIKK